MSLLSIVYSYVPLNFMLSHSAMILNYLDTTYVFLAF